MYFSIKTGANIWYLFYILSNFRIGMVCIRIELYTHVDWIYRTWNAKQANKSIRKAARREH